MSHMKTQLRLGYTYVILNNVNKQAQTCHVLMLTFTWNDVYFGRYAACNFVTNYISFFKKLFENFLSLFLIFTLKSF